MALSVASVVFVLWLVTLLLSDMSWATITLFWVAAGAVLAVWIGRDLRGSREAGLRKMRSILRRIAADTFEIKASAFVELEEVEDEGACYAFQLQGDRIVFVVGQEFYPRAKFPSLNFSVIYLLDEQGQRGTPLIGQGSPRTTPQRTISAQEKRLLFIPDHLEMIAGRLENLEDILKRRQAGPL